MQVFGKRLKQYEDVFPPNTQHNNGNKLHPTFYFSLDKNSHIKHC